jgi:hypothetical protein
MEGSMKEELKGNQHKIDANKNNKIDAHDFKLLRAGKKVAKEEVEQVEEAAADKAAEILAKKREERMEKMDYSKEKTAKSNVRKVEGKYGKEEMNDNDEDDTPKKATKKGVFKRRYNTKVYKEQFSELLDSYVNGGLKGIMENLEVVEVEEQEMISEEVDNETFTKEVEAQKAKAEGKGKKADVAAASVQAVKNEEVEQIDELSKKTYVGAMQTLSDPDGERGRHDTSDKLISRAKKQHGDKFAKDLEGVHKMHWGRSNQASGSDKLKSATPVRTTQSGKANKQDVKTKSKEIQSRLGTHKKPNLPEQVEERTLTEPEMKKREEVVKSMKKNLSGFKERYGKRGKEVMYATATKIAKGDK